MTYRLFVDHLALRRNREGGNEPVVIVEADKGRFLRKGETATLTCGCRLVYRPTKEAHQEPQVWLETEQLPEVG